MDIDWAALGSVFGVSLGATVALVSLFTLGIVGLSKHETAVQAGGAAHLARTGAFVSFAACAAAVAYGIYLIVT